VPTKKNPKVSVEIGMTLKLNKDGKDTFQFIRPTIGIADIDANGDEKDLKRQLDLAKSAISQTWDTVSDLVEKQINEELGLSSKEQMKGKELGT